jgi:hypothetical protein
MTAAMWGDGLHLSSRQLSSEASLMVAQLDVEATARVLHPVK